MFDRRTMLKSIPFLSAIPWVKAEVPAKPVVEKEPVFNLVIGYQFPVILHFQSDFIAGKNSNTRETIRYVTATVDREEEGRYYFSACIPSNKQDSIIGMRLWKITLKPFGLSEHRDPAYRTKPDGESEILINGDLFLT